MCNRPAYLVALDLSVHGLTDEAIVRETPWHKAALTGSLISGIRPHSVGTIRRTASTNFHPL